MTRNQFIFMNTLYTRFYLMLIALCLACVASAQQAPFRVVGYYSLKAATGKSHARQLKYLTHINLWFLNPDSTGSYTQDLSGLKPFVDKAHRRKIKVLFSIGGGSKQP